MSNFLLEIEHRILMLELQEASRLSEHLGDDLIRAAETIIHCESKLIVSGISKSDHIGKKLVATFVSTGTPAPFAHPAEALYSGLGMLDSHDVMLFIFYSDSVEEPDFIVSRLEEKSIPLLAMVGKPISPLALTAKTVPDIAVEREACPIHPTPTLSIVNILMLSDVLVMAVIQARDFNKEDFAHSYPAGVPGACPLNRVHRLVRRDEEVPWVGARAGVTDVMLEFSRTGPGLVTVCDETNRVQDVFADGDLCRWLIVGGMLNDDATQATTRNGVTLQAGGRVVKAKERPMKHKISTVLVVDEGD